MRQIIFVGGSSQFDPSEEMVGRIKRTEHIYFLL
jgi:hypothetical protein